MDSLKAGRCQFWYTIIFLLSTQGRSILCSRIYKVGDLDAWGIPSSSNPQVYTTWSKFHNLTIGDSIFFLYPPSQDSVIQVKKEAFNSCNLKDPILYMNNGNSLFNITKGGNFYFTSGVEGHCEKSQKLHISVYGNGTSEEADAPAASAPSYPTVFGGSIPVQGANSTSSSSPLLEIPLLLISAAAALFL
ncbi:hypothetical protein ACS0TY_011273 [Phlomoides rotata]